MKSLPLPIILSLALAAAAHAQITTDGQRDAAYGPPRAVQLAPTSYGDNTNADPLAANGSELDVAHAVIRDGKLHILLTGNLETNFNKLNVFIDSRPAGQNTLANDNPDVDFNGLNNLAGLKFDNGFEADFFFTIGGGGDPVEFFTNFAELGNPGVGTYLGGTGSPNAGFPVTLANDVQVGIDNSNTGGVTDSNASAAASVATGIEFSIPLALIGNPTAQVKVCAFISNSNHDSLSNQVLGSLPAGYGNLASPSTVDFSNETNFPGPQFFTAPWQVTNTNDSGAGSLRQTIADAPAGSIITFDPSLSAQTITLGGTQLLIGKSLAIDASALPGGIIIDADERSRVLEVVGGVTAVLTRLHLTGGKVPDAGVFPGDWGGGIFNGGALTLNQCTLSGNSASYGGGIYNGGTLTLTTSTLSGNSASFTGGGITNSQSRTLTLTNSTLSGNSANFSGGGIFNNFATLTLTNSTLSGNFAKFDGVGVGGGGGIFNLFGALTLTNSIVAANSSSARGPDVFNDSGSINPEGMNLLSNLTGSGLSAGSNVLVAAPHLAPLGDYGGPTQTMPPLPGSPVINAAGTTNPGGTDQRGLPRFVGGALDIGAVEYQGTADLAAFWNTDWDDDGIPFGIERALGNDPFTAGPNEEGNLTVPQFNPSGHATLRFRIGDAARADTIWILQRSPDLSPGSWQEIYRYDGPAFEETTQPDIAALWTTTITPNTTFAHVTDQNPPPGKGFYRFVAELVEP